MRRLILWSAAFSSLALFAVDARAQTAFVEGHVFNFQSGRPIANAKVDIYVTCAICLSPIGRLVDSDVTDRNGFYEVDVPLSRDVSTDLQPQDLLAFIRVSCPTSEGAFRGASDTTLRDETLRRDIYLRAPVELIRCADSVQR